MYCRIEKGVTLLWALRSPCNLNCLYCYFGTLGGGPQDRSAGPSHPGELSHVGHTDLSLIEMLQFISTFTSELVHRVFIAGGEPLIWQGRQRVLTALKAVGCEVIVCTNGLPLRRDAVATSLLAIGIDAISVSLDSFDATYNDHWRQDRSGQGWQGVVEGLQNIVRLRNTQGSLTKIGVYSVITQKNIDHIVETGRLVADLGCDYFIVQPVSLTSDHELHDELCLSATHREAFVAQIQQLKHAHLGIHLAHPNYIRQVITALSPGPLPMIKSCFGGRDLFFIEPDGSLWSCPSTYKIQNTLPDQYLSVKGQDAALLFSRERRSLNTDCSLFTQDCVNMWQLMAFDDILAEGGPGDEQLL